MKILVTGAWLACIACSKDPPPRDDLTKTLPAPGSREASPRTLPVSFSSPVPPDRVLVDGTLQPLSADRASIQVGFNDHSSAHQIIAEWDLPCGTLRIPANRDRWFEDPPPGHFVLVYVDNRGGAATTLSIGTWSRAIATDWHGLVYVPRPACSAGEQLALAASVIGKVPKDAFENVLIDTSGKRCYRTKEILYGSAGPETRLATRTLRPATYQRVSARVGFFQTEPPSTSTAPEILLQVSDLKCPR